MRITPLLPLTTTHLFSINWNIQVHVWLKYYVMMRLIDRSAKKSSPKNISILMTFIMNSVWHGLYPGYIIFFVACGVLELQTKIAPTLKVVQTICRILPPLAI